MVKSFYAVKDDHNIKISDKIMTLNCGIWNVHDKSKRCDEFCNSEWLKITGIKIEEDKQVCIDISELRFSIVGEQKDRRLNAKDKRRLRLLKEKACIKIKAKKPFYIGADDLDEVVVSSKQMNWGDENKDRDCDPSWCWDESTTNVEEVTDSTMKKIFDFHIPWGVQLCISPKSMKVTKLK
jgi:hypothetical protein